MDSAQIQAVMSLLLQSVSHDLSLWTQSQRDLYSAGFPLDDPSYPNACQSPAPEASPGVAAPQTAVIQQIAAPPQPKSGLPSSKSPTQPKSGLPSSKSPTTSTLSAYHALLTPESTPSEQHQTPEDRQTALTLLNARLTACRKCMLGAKTRGIVTGRGNVDASIFFVGAGANPAELESDRFMCGEASELLEKIVSAMAELSSLATPEHIYAANVIKCACQAPLALRNEISRTCLAYLREEIRLVKPQIIIIWGEFAYHAIFGGNETISQVRGLWKNFEGTPALATHHPYEMIKNPKLKQRVWQDLKLAVQSLKS